MDPKDRVDFVADFKALLTGNEKIAAASLTLGAESVALGLTLIQNPPHGPNIINGVGIEAWFQVNAGLQANAAFDVGATLPIEATILTDAVPPRTFQRTLVITVKQL